MGMRIRLDIAYCGTDFHGWAVQPGQRTVQGELELALAAVLREPVVLTVAGRTDAGVHALGQVAHFDVSEPAWAALPGRSDRDPAVALVRAVNAVLARQYSQSNEQALVPALPVQKGGLRKASPRGFSDVVVRRAAVVPESFDARFSALWRRYSYRIADCVTAWDPLRKDVLWMDRELDIAAMNRAAGALLGEHDFLSFCKPREGASTVRTLLECGFVRTDPESSLIVATVRADAFCHSQVRALMGALFEVGRGRKPESWPAELLANPSRTGVTAPIAPGHPLTLEEVGYPPAAEYGEQAQRARVFRGACA